MPGVRIDFSGVRLLAEQLGTVPQHMRRELRPRLREVADPIVQDMRNRASWSSRIPGAIGLRVSFSFSRGGVFIRLNRKQAPHGPLYELGNAGSRAASSFRHPVFGNREVWVSQQTRPFFFPALRGKREALVKEMEGLVEDALHSAGFKG